MWAPVHRTHICLLHLIPKSIPLFSGSHFHSFGKSFHQISAVWLWVFIYMSISNVRWPDSQSAFKFISKRVIGVKVRVLCKPLDLFNTNHGHVFHMYALGHLNSTEQNNCVLLTLWQQFKEIPHMSMMVW